MRRLRRRLSQWIQRVGWELVVGMLLLVVLAVVLGVRIGLGIAHQSEGEAGRTQTLTEDDASVW